MMKFAFHNNRHKSEKGGIRTLAIPMLLGALACLPVVLAAPSRAEPSPAVDYLMHEPATMLDWGLARIEAFLIRNRGVLTANKGNLLDTDPSIQVAYAWEEDRIQIFLKMTLQTDVKKTPEHMTGVRQHAEFVITYLRGALTMHPYDAFFRHQGFRSKASPENLGQDLAAITDIHITIQDHRQNILSRCRAPLSGRAIVWSSMGGA